MIKKNVFVDFLVPQNPYWNFWWEIEPIDKVENLLNGKM